MKRYLSTIILIFTLLYQGLAARSITPWDIAKWYLDSDLAIICSVYQTDTLLISKYDSLVDNGFHLRYNVLREKYHISVDSVVKKSPNINEIMDTIFTPEFSTMPKREKVEFEGFDSNGDSILINTVEISTNYNDDSYYRIKSSEKCLVILSKINNRYEIDYQSEWDSSLMRMITDIELQGEDYLTPQSSQSIKLNDLYIYPNPFNDVIKIQGANIKEIEIKDINGKTNNVDFTNPNCIDLSYLRNGIYYITIITDENKWTTKIIKD